MKLYKNFTVYKPTDLDILNAAPAGTMFLKSSNGTDWYACQKQFKTNTVKVVFRSDGVIVSFATDISSLWPVDQSVAEVEASTVPNGFSLDGTWIYNEFSEAIETRVYTLAEIKTQVDTKISNQKTAMMALISPLQFAVDLEMATDDEKTRLKSLQKYVVLLNRVPLQESYPTGIVWPEIPTT